MSRPEKIAEANAAIDRLSHPHNRYSRECQQAIQRWRQVLADLEKPALDRDQAYADKLKDNFQDWP
jgi:hypothetical protein